MAADQELKDWLIAQGETPERAEQIAGNHPEEVRAQMQHFAEAVRGTPPTE